MCTDFCAPWGSSRHSVLWEGIGPEAQVCRIASAPVGSVLQNDALCMFPRGCKDTVARDHLLCKGTGGYTHIGPSCTKVQTTFSIGLEPQM